MGLTVHNHSSLSHGIHVAAINLDGHRPLVVAHLQLGQTLAYHADECIARHKLGIHHGRTHLPAQQTETYVRDILHRGQQHGLRPQVNVSYLHA